MTKKISAIIPVYNEEKYIQNCMNACLTQNYNLNEVEFLLIDGNSTDDTKKLIDNMIHNHPGVFRYILNEKQNTPHALNLGIKEAEGDYILIMGCHAIYETDYLAQCVNVLETVEADIVGGCTETRSNTFIGKVMSIVLSSKFGVGNSSFRVGAKDGYIDTVFCGACRKSVYDKFGLFDERLFRNQDLEYNKRVINKGGKIYLCNAIKLAYYTPDTLYLNLKKAFHNGEWNIYTMRLCPGIIGYRHIIPLLFVMSLIIVPIFSFFIFIKTILIMEFALYLILDLFFSFRESCKSKYINFIPLLICYPLFHISYGVGSLFGIVKAFKKNGEKQL